MCICICMPTVTMIYKIIIIGGCLFCCGSQTLIKELRTQSNTLRDRVPQRNVEEIQQKEEAKVTELAVEEEMERSGRPLQLQNLSYSNALVVLFCKPVLHTHCMYIDPWWT